VKLAAICDRDTATGFRLAGINDLFIPDENPIKTFDEVIERTDIGVVFITEKISESISKYLKDFRIQHDTPIIIEIPDKQGHLVDHIDFISHLIKKAVGIDISKKEK
jgi:V/A-type H+-transporting ATPase subunit F